MAKVLQLQMWWMFPVLCEWPCALDQSAQANVTAPPTAPPPGVEGHALSWRARAFGCSINPFGKWQKRFAHAFL